MSALGIAPYFPFARVIPAAQQLTGGPDGVVHSRITFEPDPRRRPVCSGCGGKTWSVHSTSLRRVMDLPLAGARTELLERGDTDRRGGVRSLISSGLSSYAAQPARN